MRPLGLPSWSDKLVVHDPPALGGVLRAAILRSLARFPSRSWLSHALSEVAVKWTGTTWFIEGDIARCSDELDHEIMLEILGEKIHDSRFLGFCVTCCELDTWRIGMNETLPARRRAVVSPILSIFTWTGWTISSKQFHTGIHPRETPQAQHGVSDAAVRDRAGSQTR